MDTCSEDEGEALMDSDDCCLLDDQRSSFVQCFVKFVDSSTAVCISTCAYLLFCFLPFNTSFVLIIAMLVEYMTAHKLFI